MINLIEINHKKMEVLQKGETGKVIVILTGMGCSFYEWYEIVETLSQSNKVIMYHRPGLGASEWGEEVRNTLATVNELFELLHVLGIEESIYLVGHSYGGLCAQHFIKMYPHLVAGLVLVDSTSVDLKILDELDLPLLNEISTDEVWMETCKNYSYMTNSELEDVIKPTLHDNQKHLPREVQDSLLKFQISPLLYKAMLREMESWKNDALIIKAITNNVNIPLVVLGRDCEYSTYLAIKEGQPKEEIQLLEHTWQKLIQHQIHLSNKSEYVSVPKSGHSIHLDRPDIVIHSINKLIMKKVF